MPDVSVLDVFLHGTKAGTLTLLQGDRTIFAFDQAYIDDPNRPTLSLSFKDRFGDLLTELSPTQTVVPPFFSNLLPEGPLREYLARKGGVSQKREFFLLWVLGRDLPGALTIRPADGEAWPPGFDEPDSEQRKNRHRNAMHFSLAGVQLKFSAIKNAGKSGGLTIPAEGVGGSWIVKLPSERFAGVPENEFSMMTLASKLGMDVPEIQLLDLDSIEGLPDGIGHLNGPAFAIRRFDRSDDGPVHIEDFAQVFGLWPDEKYKKASARNIANVIGTESNDLAVTEFIRRLVFNTLIGNADMHVKNWSLIYPDRRTPTIAPAYDFLSTIPYIPDDFAAIKYARTKRMSEFSRDELKYLAAKARLQEKLVLDTAEDTVARFHDIWRAEKANLPLSSRVIEDVETHMSGLAILESGT